MITVIAGIIFKDEKILVARRAKHKNLAGYWEFPGGKQELGETPEDCLKREILEELNIEIAVVSFFLDCSYNYDNNNNIFLRSFICNYLMGEPLLIDHDEINWVTKSELRYINFAPADLPIVSALTNSTS